MALTTVSGRIDESVRDRLDKMVGDRTGGRAAIVADAIAQYVGVVPVDIELEPHPLQAEVDSIPPKIAKLTVEIGELESAFV